LEFLATVENGLELETVTFCKLDENYGITAILT